MYRKTLTVGLALIAIPALSTAAYADGIVSVDAQPKMEEILDVAPSIAAAAIAVEPVTIIANSEITPPETDNALSDDALSDLRGGQAIVIGNQTLNAVNSGSTLNGNYTAGSVALTDNALSNFNGLGNVLINTGAQNNLQSAMNVTINFAQ
jgi:hypothetical protein